jgi:membrane protein implicated in regulation of membrane protease activity
MNLSELPFWSWWILACALVVAEIATTTFTFLFFAISALFVGVAQWLGLKSMTLELILFGVMGLVLMLVFRKGLLAKFRGADNRWDRGSDVAQVVKLTESVPARGEGRTEYQGTSWAVRNESDSALVAGQEAVVVRTEGVKLIVRAKV